MRWKSVGAGTALTVAMLAAGVLTTTAANAAPAAATGQVTIVHGVRGLLADVWVDGKQALSSFSPERVTDPITLPAGTHEVDIRQHGMPADSKPVVSGRLKVDPGSHLSVAAGLKADGSPVLEQFDDNALRPLLGHTATGSAVVVRNLAETPNVRALIDKTTINVPTSPGGIAQAVRVGPHTLSLSSSVDASSVLPSEQVVTQSGRATVLYLIGSADNASLGWLAETVQPGVTAQKAAIPPKKIESGNSGLASADDERASLSGSGLNESAIAGIIGGALLLGMGLWFRLRRS
ncbi:MAG TPA: DUF4397 domain-containing protein [Mycobacteriales bacterium]|nr:DUF4397 domain-containing protein [Mycobacteriales bacterium]